MSVRSYKAECLRRHVILDAFGIKDDLIGQAVSYVHNVLDSIDGKLLEGGGERLCELVGLANLSSIIGNLFRGGIVKNSAGDFAPNAPHTYPDLLGKGSGCKDIEIKVALETNKPKGHLIKPGPHLTVRYVLTPDVGDYVRGKTNRGKVAWIWEIRAGSLENIHFNCSNTEGDSGKTAVINKLGMAALHPVYFDDARCPFSTRGSSYSTLVSQFKRD